MMALQRVVFRMTHLGLLFGAGFGNTLGFSSFQEELNILSSKPRELLLSD